MKKNTANRNVVVFLVLWLVVFLIGMGLAMYAAEINDMSLAYVGIAFMIVGPVAVLLVGVVTVAIMNMIDGGRR